MSSCPLITNSMGCPCDVMTIPPFGPFLGCAWARLAAVVITISSAYKPCLNILTSPCLNSDLESLGRTECADLRRGKPLQRIPAESEEKHRREHSIEQSRA